MLRLVYLCYQISYFHYRKNACLEFGQPRLHPENKTGAIWIIRDTLEVNWGTGCWRGGAGAVPLIQQASQAHGYSPQRSRVSVDILASIPLQWDKFQWNMSSGQLPLAVLRYQDIGQYLAEFRHICEPHVIRTADGDMRGLGIEVLWTLRLLRQLWDVLRCYQQGAARLVMWHAA